MVRSLFRQLHAFLLGHLAFCLVISLDIVDPANEDVVFTLGLPIFAQIHILSVVSHHHRDYSAILMQLNYEIGCEVRWKDAVDGSDWVAVPLLGDALWGGEIEEIEDRPQVAGVAADESHFVGGLVGDDTFQFLSEHSQGRSSQYACEVAILDERVVVFKHILEVPFIILVVFGRKRSSQVSISQQGFVQIRHDWESGLSVGEVEEHLHFRDFQGVFPFEYSHLGSNFRLPASHQSIVVRAVIQNIVYISDWQRLKSHIQSKWQRVISLKPI